MDSSKRARLLRRRSLRRYAEGKDGVATLNDVDWGSTISSLANATSLLSSVYGPSTAGGTVTSSEAAAPGGWTYDTLSYTDPTIAGQQAYKEKNAGTLKNTGTLAAAGASTGAAIGSIFPGYGTAIGAAIGAIAGGITGLVTSSASAHKAKKRATEHARLMQTGVAGYNRQNEARAASEAMASGGFALGKEPQVWRDAGGFIAGTPTALAAPGEGYYDASSGKGSIIVAPGAEGGDIVPIDAREGDAVGITSRRIINPFSGRSFAEDSYPALMALETLSSLKPKGKSERRAVNASRKMIASYMTDLLNKQREVKDSAVLASTKPRKGYAWGKSLTDALALSLPSLATLGAAYDQRRYYATTPLQYDDIYAPSSSSGAALGILGSLRSNPWQRLTDLTKRGRENIYAVRQSGYNPSLRAALLNQTRSDIASQRSSILRDSEEKNRAYRQAYAQALLAQGNLEAQRRQEANRYRSQSRAAAEAARLRGIETGTAGMLNALGTLGKDLQTSGRYHDVLSMYYDPTTVPLATETVSTPSLQAIPISSYYTPYRLRIPSTLSI